MQKQVTPSSSTASFRNISTYRDELYGFAILWIMLFHSTAGYPSITKYFLAWGNQGVDMFAFLSGISLYFAYQRKPTLTSYLHHRTIRLIIPVLTVYLWYWLPGYFQHGMNLPQLISKVVLLDFWITGERSLWFISYIAAAYLLFPYFYSYIYENPPEHFIFRVALLLLISLGFILLLYFLCPDFYATAEIALLRFPVFILGVSCGSSVYQAKSIGHTAKILNVFLVLVLIVCYIGLNIHAIPNWLVRLFGVFPAVCLVFLLGQLFALTKGSILNKALAFLGSVSIELYLIHYLSRMTLSRLCSFYDPSKLSHYYLMLCACIPAAWLDHRVNQWISLKILSSVNGQRPCA